MCCVARCGSVGLELCAKHGIGGLVWCPFGIDGFVLLFRWTILFLFIFLLQRWTSVFLRALIFCSVFIYLFVRGFVLSTSLSFFFFIGLNDWCKNNPVGSTDNALRRVDHGHICSSIEPGVCCTMTRLHVL